MYAGRIAERAGVASLFAGPAPPLHPGAVRARSRQARPPTRRQPLATIPGLPPYLGWPAARLPLRAALRVRHRAGAATEEPDADGAYPPTRTPSPASTRCRSRRRPRRRVVPAARYRLDPGRDATTPWCGSPTWSRTSRCSGGPFARRKRRGAARSPAFALRHGAARRFGIVGESGCGKSTLGRLVVGLETADHRHDLLRRPGPRARWTAGAAKAHRRKVQLMFQDSYASMDPRMRVGGDPARAAGHPGHRATGPSSERGSRGLLDDVGLPRGAVDRYPHEFSGGQRQRLGLARALALLAVADRRRRTGLRARRLRPGADPQPDAGAAARERRWRICSSRTTSPWSGISRTRSA